MTEECETSCIYKPLHLEEDTSANSIKTNAEFVEAGEAAI